MLSRKQSELVRLSDYLWENMRQAKDKASTLTRAVLSEADALTNAQDIDNAVADAIKCRIDKILAEHSHEVLTLKAWQVRVSDSSLKDVTISWKVTGSINLIGMLDNSGDIVTSNLVDSAITETWTCPRDINTDTAMQAQIRAGVMRKIMFFEEHFGKLNKSIISHNQGLERVIPDLVAKRITSLRLLKDIEISLNRPA